MAVERSQEHILGRALAVVPIPVSAIAHPSSRPTPTDGFALTVVLIDAATGLPYVASGGGGGGGGAVTIADGADVTQGDISDPAWSGTGDATLVAIGKATYTLLNTPLTELAKTPLMGTSDLTYAFNSSSLSTERSLVSATAAQTTKGYMMQVTAAAAATVDFLDGSGGAVLFTLEFPAAGAYTLDLTSRPYFKGSANTAIYVKSSTAVKTTVALFYVKGA